MLKTYARDGKESSHVVQGLTCEELRAEVDNQRADLAAFKQAVPVSISLGFASVNMAKVRIMWPGPSCPAWEFAWAIT